MTTKSESWTLPDNWREEEPVREWLSRITRKAGYSRELALFLEYVQLTPSEIVEKRKKQRKSEDPKISRWVESQIVEWVDTLYARGLKKWTVKSYLRSVQSFFKSQFMKCDFLRNEIRHEERQDVRANHKSEWVLDQTELRVLHDLCRSPFDKSLLLALAHSGMSPTDIGELIITEQILSDMKAKRHSFIEKDRKKSGILQQTFLSDECLHYLELYYRERKEWKIGDFVFMTQKGATIDSEYMTKRFKLLAITAFGEKGKEFKCKNLRDILVNACEYANLSEGKKNSLMGWEKKRAEGSYKLNEGVMRNAYEQIFDYLTIDGSTKSREEFEDLKNALITQEKEIAGLKTRLDVTIKKFEQWEPVIKMLTDKYPDIIEKPPPHVDIGHERKRD